MAKVETIDVACGRGGAVGLNGIFRGLACAAISAPSVRTPDATLKGGA